MSINYFLRNGGRNPQKRTFVRRQWPQYLLFLFFTQHLFQSSWSLLFDVNQLFSQKWSPKVSKANFCSKTVGTIFAVFVLHSTSFQINLIIIVWHQSIIFSEMKPEALKSKLLLEDSGHSICCFLFFFQHLSQSIWSLMFVVNQFFSQKWSPKFSKAKFCSKTVSTIFAVFFFLSYLNISRKLWCRHH